MTTQTVTRQATLPRVNLLPPEIGERKQLQRIQAGVVLAVVVTVGIVGVVYYQGKHNVQAAKQEVATAVAQNATLTQKVATFQDVTATASRLASSEAMLSQAMSAEVDWSTYLSDLGFLPKSTWLTDISFTNSLAPGSLAASTQAPPKIGVVSLKGVALKYASMADWLDALQPEKGLANLYFTNANEVFIGPTKVVDFQGSADLTSSALSARCDKAGSC